MVWRSARSPCVLSHRLHHAVKHPPERTELRVATAAREGDVKILEAFVSLQLRRIEVAHAEVEFRKALEREEAPHIGRKRRQGRELLLDAFALGRNDRRMVAPVLFPIHLSVHRRIVSESQ